MSSLKINEIFYSIQGESYLSGLPFIFVRLTGCHQRCVYCDTQYAFYEGKEIELENILDQIQSYPTKNILITGGEPLLQVHVIELMNILIQRGYRVCLETSGSLSVGLIPQDVIKVMDIKTPGSGESQNNDYRNIDYLTIKDEIKFVVTNSEDIDWSLDRIMQYNLDKRCHVSLSPVDANLNVILAEKILASGLQARQQIQLHKLIWPEKKRAC